MNILHHKSWHVRNKNNIAKVRAAEKKAREEEEAKEKRRLVAESEARVNLLRTKARSANSSRGEDATITSIAAILDGKEPSAVGEDRQNVDHEKELKRDREEWEKKVGILTYLGQGCDQDSPWYLLDHNSRMLSKEEPSTSSSEDKTKTRLKHDPLVDIERHLAAMKKRRSQDKPSLSQTRVTVSTPPVNVKVGQDVDSSQRKKHKKSKKSKQKKHKKSKRSSTRSESETSFSDSSLSEDDEAMENEKRKKLEALRDERIRREKIERERTNHLLNKSIKCEPKVELDDRKRGYNSQFNPHLARQNQERFN